MRIYCKLSGVSFLAEGFTNKMSVGGIHPIFNVPLRSLLNRAGDWARGSLNKQERKLLFLALLHSTKLVEFRATARPSDSVVQSNMEFLLKFIAWHNDINSAQLRLPRFVISHDTATLANVYNWMRAWEDQRQAWKNNFIEQNKRAKLSTTEASLHRLINSSSKDSSQYAGILANWAMEAADVPKNLREYWTQLFKLKGLDVYNARTVDLEEMLEHMEEKLPVYESAIYANSVLRHVRMLVGRNKAGLTYGLGFATPEDAVSYEAAMKNPFRIVEDSVESENKEIIAANAPEVEPKQEAYKSRIEFLRAKAAWVVKVSQEAVADQIEEEEKKQEQAAALDTVNEDEAEIEATEDEAEIISNIKPGDI